MDLFVSVEQAQAAIRSRIKRTKRENVPLSGAFGRHLAEDVVSGQDVPSFVNSAMDGFAVRSGDLATSGGSLEIVGEVRAGQWPSHVLREGQAIRIMTGAPVPTGANAVVPVEWTTVMDDRVHVDRGLSEGRHVRPAGENLRKGTRALDAGSRIGAAEIAVLATLGVSSVPVYRKPRIAVIATGDELVDPGETPGPGQIRNSNGPALAARVESAGGIVAHLLHARDNEEDLGRVIDAASASDVIVFSGGVSMGEYDLVRVVLESRGLEPVFWKVRQRPGKPLAFGMLDGTPVVGLPGNPVSSGVCFDQYVRPAIVLAQGGGSPDRPRFSAVLGEDFPKPRDLHVFARGVATVTEGGTLTVAQAGKQGSNLSMSLVRANCLVHLPADVPTAAKGTTADIEWLAE